MHCSRIQHLAAVIAVVVSACSAEPPRDEAPLATALLAPVVDRVPASFFYPMSPGNRWVYDWQFTMQIVPDDGPPGPPEILRARIDVEQGDYETIGGREYIVETETYSIDPHPSRFLYRQDRAGLYVFVRSKDDGKAPGRTQRANAMRDFVQRVAGRSDVDPRCVEEHLARVARVRDMLHAFGDAAPSPPGGVLPGEIQQLQYPLHPGAGWVIRDTPMFAATVEAHEQFLGFSCYRIRVDNEFLNADDRVHFWFSRCGQIGWRAHMTTPAVSSDGQLLGLLVSDEAADISEIYVSRGGCELRQRGGDHGGNVHSYPIAIGNRWTYEIAAAEYEDGRPVWSATFVTEDEQVEWREIDGRTYMEQRFTPRGVTPAFSVTLVRQDRAGLYQLDPPGTRDKDEGDMPSGVASALPRSAWLTALRAVVAGPPGGAEEGEAVTLVYPLRTGASWTIRDSEILGVWTATVEGRDRLSLPAGEFNALRVRIDRDFASPGDMLLVWYAPEGLVKVSAQLRTDKGHIEEEWRLFELELHR